MKLAAAAICATLLTLAVAGPALADLTKAKAERNPDRRARLALENAALQLRAAGDADKAGDWGKAKAALAELSDSVDLAYESLKTTGRNPRNSSQYKNFEIKTRTLLKGLGDFRERLDFDQREEVKPLADHLQAVHDQVLESILEPKKK